MKAHSTLNAELRELATEYVMGTLSEEGLASYEDHLSECSTCQTEIAEVRRVTSMLEPAEREGKAKPQLWERIQERIRKPAIAFLYAEAESWTTLGPGIEVRTLSVDKEHDRITYLARLAAGAKYPPHPHSGPEECLVMSGDLMVGDVRMTAGDFQRIPAGVEHPLQSTENGCEILLVSAVRDVPF